MKLPLVLLVVGLCASALVSVPSQDEARVIESKMWHLGNDPAPEWTEASEEPEGSRLDVTFAARVIEGEGTLRLKQRNVNDAWHIEINGTRIATLERRDALEEVFYPIPPGILVDGENTFALVPDALVDGVATDDITIGAISYYERSFRAVFDLRRVVVSVRNADSGDGLPARVTITDKDGELAPVYYAERISTAVRTGVVYTSDGRAAFELPPGEYDVYAVRGTEWSLASATLVVDSDFHNVDLALARELNTRGFVAADTHIHTLTHSGHGDSSVEERMVTLAGEGVELAIATDHNHNTDYRPTQEAMGLNEYFTPVVGNEVTTPVGHLNAFPLLPDDDVPLHEGDDVVKIVESIRAKGAKAIILNHPRWPDHETGPHGKMALNEFTGDWRGSWACAYDAMELINSQTEELEPMLLFRDWFALMNRGENVRAVASSDSHTVGGVVGQGRTYVISSTDVPSEIDVDECAANIAAGRSSISMGIFVDIRLDGRSIMGETLSARALSVESSATELVSGIELRVASSSWVRPEHVTLYANGVAVHEYDIADVRANADDSVDEPRITDVRIALDPDAAWPEHDFWLVAVVTGPGVGGPWWPQLNDYTLAATNPVFFDMDGDGGCSSPRALATALVGERGTDAEAVEWMLSRVDSATAVQVMRLVRREYLTRAENEAIGLGVAALERHPMLNGWIETLDEVR